MDLSAVHHLVQKINSAILQPITLLLVAGALVGFFYGLVSFLANQDDSNKKEEGKKHMMYGLMGLFIIFSVFGIMNMLVGTVDSVS